MTAIKKILYYSYLPLLAILVSCNPKNNTEEPEGAIIKQPIILKTVSTNTFDANIVTEMGSNILSVFQDRSNNYWFGTQSMGVYHYNGKTLIQFTEKDGLANNQVQTIQEDNAGNIWFGTGAFGVSRFDGQTITTITATEQSSEWKTETSDLWFNAGGGAYRSYNNLLSYLPLAKTVNDSRSSQNSPNQLSQYAVYSILKDRKGNIWCGTQSMGVCRYDGISFTWFTEKGLAGPAVLALFEDRNGNVWFGNNGSGLFKYDGSSLTNVTTEKGLGNVEFFKTSKVSAKSNATTMSRIYSINEDNDGMLWIGTVDSGVWRYDGKKLTNYTTKDRLTSNAVTVIYKDKKGELWFGTEGKGVCKFNGTSFTSFAF